MKPRVRQPPTPTPRTPIDAETRRFIGALARADCAEDYRKATEREAATMAESGR